MHSHMSSHPRTRNESQQQYLTEVETVFLFSLYIGTQSDVTARRQWNTFFIFLALLIFSLCIACTMNTHPWIVLKNSFFLTFPNDLQLKHSDTLLLLVSNIRINGYGCFTDAGDKQIVFLFFIENPLFSSFVWLSVGCQVYTRLNAISSAKDLVVQFKWPIQCCWRLHLLVEHAQAEDCRMMAVTGLSCPSLLSPFFRFRSPLVLSSCPSCLSLLPRTRYLDDMISSKWYHDVRISLLSLSVLSVFSVLSPHIYACVIPVRGWSRPGRLPASLFSPLFLDFAFARFVSLSLSWINTSGQSAFVPNPGLFFSRAGP